MASDNVFGIIYSQVSFLDTYFPGLGVALSYIHPLASGNLHVGAQLLCACGLIAFLLKFAYKHIMCIMEDYLTFTFHISGRDEIHDMLHSWIQSQSFATRTRSTLVALGKESERSAQGRPTKKILQYMPWNTKKFFWYKGKLLCVRSEETRSWRDEKLSVTCFGTSPRILKELLDECKTLYEEKTLGKTAVYENRDGWTLAITRDRRHMDTIVLPEHVKRDFLKDVEEYLDPKARSWYADRGLPYRRGYLLHGRPGTGKSSLCFAVAGYFDLDIYVLNLATVNDATLDKLLRKLPSQCIILLEDVDAIETTRSRADEEVSEKYRGPKPGSVTLSGLLNAMDGVASQEGRVLIMTTNHIEHLDEALIRPGRVDKKIEFGFANRDMLERLFRFIYRPTTSDFEAGRASRDDNHVIEKLARSFVDRVPEMMFSPAQILAFLLEHRNSPREAVDSVLAWVEGEGEGCVPLSNPTWGTSEASESGLDYGLTIDDLFECVDRRL